MKFFMLLFAVLLLLLPLSATAQDGAYDVQTSPVDLLASYYNAINRQDYQRAYGYWETPPNAYNDFVRGFSETVYVQVIVQPPTRMEGAAGSSYVQIPTVLIATLDDGTQQTFAGCFTARHSNLQPPDVPVEATLWHLYSADVIEFDNTALIPELLMQACAVDAGMTM